MTVIVDASRVLQIAAGLIALFVAPGALLIVRGGPWRGRWGKVYFWSMVVVGVTAVGLGAVGATPILLSLALVSLYLAFSGYRTLFRSRPGMVERATSLDWTVTLLALMGSAGLVAYGAVELLSQLRSGWVAVVFGALGLRLSATEVDLFRFPSREPRARWVAHAGYQLGAYVAAVSAFSAVHFVFLPSLIRWLWPAVIGVPGILIWQRVTRRRIAGGS